MPESMLAVVFLVCGGILLLIVFLQNEFKISTPFFRVEGTIVYDYRLRFVAMIIGVSLLAVGLNIYSYKQIDLVLQNFSESCEENWNLNGKTLTADCKDTEDKIHASSLEIYGKCKMIENIDGELKCTRNSEES